jgi:hypothetical protein
MGCSPNALHNACRVLSCAHIHRCTNKSVMRECGSLQLVLQVLVHVQVAAVLTQHVHLRAVLTARRAHLGEHRREGGDEDGVEHCAEDRDDEEDDQLGGAHLHHTQCHTSQ